MKSGIYQLTEDQYHADPCEVPSLSNSIAKILLTKSPYHAWLAHPKLNPNFKADESSRFDLGSAAHALLLEGAAAKIAIIDAEDWRTKAAKEARDTARLNGLLPILAKHNQALNLMVAKAQDFMANCPDLPAFKWDEGKAEQTLFWEDRGVQCRGRLDWLANNGEFFIDYKTCDNAEPKQFSRQMGRMNYDLQHEFYSRGIQLCGASIKKPIGFFLAQEIEYPYACSLHGLSNAYIEIANEKVNRAVNLWKDCLNSDKWASYTNRICYAEPSNWQIEEMLNQQEPE